MKTVKVYKYDRPAAGQIEERWFASLPPHEQARVEARTKAEIHQRRDAWNATRPSHRHIPRPE